MYPQHPSSTLFPYTTLFRSEVGGGIAAGQVLAGYAEPPVPHRPGRVDHRVVRRHQVVTGHVLAEVYPAGEPDVGALQHLAEDRKSTRLNSSHQIISYAVFCLNVPAAPEFYPLSLHDALPI